MQDDLLDKLFREWSMDRLPDETKREKILRNVFDESLTPVKKRSRFIPCRQRTFIAVSAGLGIAVATILFVLFLQPDRMPGVPANVETAQNEVETAKEPIRVSVLVLWRIAGSESAVEFLEDAVLLAEEQKLHEIELGGHRMFLWIYPLEKSLYLLDLGIDKTAETGIVAVPDRTQALHLNSNGDRFDVFVSVM